MIMAREDHSIRIRQVNMPGYRPRTIEYCDHCRKEGLDLNDPCVPVLDWNQKPRVSILPRNL